METVNSSKGASSEEDFYLTAFSYDGNTSDIFTWGTMYGGESGPGEEWFQDIEVYDYNNNTYVITAGWSTSTVGSTTSNVDEYPVAQLNATLSWFKPNNPPPSSSYARADWVISRFKVSEVNPSLSMVEDNCINNKFFEIYPNPSFAVVNIVSESVGITRIKIHDIHGKLVSSAEFFKEIIHAQIDISGLHNGVYLIEINGKYNQKLIKN